MVILSFDFDIFFEKVSFLLPAANMSTLRVMVGVKRVIDYAVKIRVKPDKSGVKFAKVLNAKSCPR